MLISLRNQLFCCSRGDFRYWQFDAVMIIQAVSSYQRHVLSYQDIFDLNLLNQS